MASIIKPLEHEDQESQQASTWVHRACFAGGCAALLISLLKSLLLLTAAGSRQWLAQMLAALMGYVVADLASGIYHWAIDNYGSAATPIFGWQIEEFQVHHQRPWAVTRRQLTDLYIQAAAVTTLHSPINVFCSDPFLLGCMGVFSSCMMFSQQFHAWSHTPKGKLPPLVAALQDAGIILGRAEHAAHHRPPYNSNYCIVNGVWNRFLDKFKFFVALEVVVCRVVGVRPRSWGEPSSD